MIRLLVLTIFCGTVALHAAPLDHSVSWLGNSFSGASNKSVQNFLIHTHVQPHGTVNTWSHWDEGGKKFGVYKDGDVVGNTNTNPNSLETIDKAGRKWKIEFEYVEPKFHEYDFKPKGITCNGEAVNFPGLYEPMALALANDGQLMVADSQTSPRQQVLFYAITDPKRPKLTRAFGDYGGIASGKPGEVSSPHNQRCDRSLVSATRVKTKVPILTSSPISQPYTAGSSSPLDYARGVFMAIASADKTWPAASWSSVCCRIHRLARSARR
jgi:hypothetical protein